MKTFPHLKAFVHRKTKSLLAYCLTSQGVVRKENSQLEQEFICFPMKSIFHGRESYCNLRLSSSYFFYSQFVVKGTSFQRLTAWDLPEFKKIVILPPNSDFVCFYVVRTLKKKPKNQTQYFICAYDPFLDSGY